MSELNEIKERIASVKGTQKITRAMYLISASKSKKAKSLLEGMKPYFQQIGDTLAQIVASSVAIDTPYITGFGSEGKQELTLVLSADKGMSGGYNHNIINLLESQKRHNDVLWVAGMLGRNQIKRRGFNVWSDFTFPVLNPSLYRAYDISSLIFKEYMTGKYSRVNLLYTNMVSAIKQEPVLIQLLPYKPEQLSSIRYEDEILDYEPDAKTVFNHLTAIYTRGIIYCALVESFASEQHARMYAMDNATKSAEDMIAQLSLSYNRARQADITQEINEIVSGMPNE